MIPDPSSPLRIAFCLMGLQSVLLEDYHRLLLCDKLIADRNLPIATQLIGDIHEPKEKNQAIQGTLRKNAREMLKHIKKSI